MAALRCTFIRTCTLRIPAKKSALYCLLRQVKNAQIIRVRAQRVICTTAVLRKEEAELDENPFYEKYAEKITVARKQNVKNGNEISYEEKFQVDKRTLEEANKFKQKIEQHAAKKTMSINPHSQSGDKPQYSEKTLDSVLHVERIAELSAEEIGQLWKKYHKNKDHISAVIPTHVYQRLEKRAQKYPLFIYPLPRDEGYEFMYSEFTGKHCYLTSLLNYQTLGENAPWILALTHFTELKDSKGIVLMVGEVDTKQLSVVDAQWLAYQIQMYYASENEVREDLLQIFNKEPQKFNHMSIVEHQNSEINTGAVTADSKLKKQ